MDIQTTFRKQLDGELHRIVDSVELDANCVQTVYYDEDQNRSEYVEDKLNLMGEFVDYYTEELFEFDPWRKEFSAEDIEHIREFVAFAHKAVRSDLNWPEFKTVAAKLRHHLMN